MTEYALEALAQSQVKRVMLVGRRGPLQAAFTIKELREMLKLPQVRTVWRPTDFEGVTAQLPHLQRPRKRITELMLKSLSEQNKNVELDSHKEFMPIFLRAPKSVEITGMEFSVTELNGDKALHTQQTERLRSDLILRSIGYKSSCADGDICFDASSGCVYNASGRVFCDASAKKIDLGLYVTGWLGTGPTGVILSTMSSAFHVGNAICEDFLNARLDTSSEKPGLQTQGKRVINWKAWRRIDKAEIAAGKAFGKPREKIVDVEEMLNIAGV